MKQKMKINPARQEYIILATDHEGVEYIFISPECGFVRSEHPDNPDLEREIQLGLGSTYVEIIGHMNFILKTDLYPNEGIAWRLSIHPYPAVLGSRNDDHWREIPRITDAKG